MDQITPRNHGSEASPGPSGEVSILSPQVISRHMPPNSAAEVLPSLWVGNLMSVSHLDGIAQSSISNPNPKVIFTVISVLSNPNLTRFATDALEQQRLRQATNDANNSSNKKDGNHNISMDIKHVIIPLKDVVDSDLLSVLPSALTAIDEALGHDINLPSPGSGTPDDSMNDNTASQMTNDHDGDENCDNPNRICLVHCAKGASRSVAVVIAYLLSRHSRRFKTFEEALSHVRNVRPQAMPNIGFVLAIRQYERELHRNPT